MLWRFLIQTHDDGRKKTEENRRQPAPRTREPADACLRRSRRVLRTAAARPLNQSSVPSIFLTTCIFSAAHTSAVTEIHSTSRSLSRFFLFTSYSCSLFASRFSEEFRLKPAQNSAARASNNTNSSLPKTFFMLQQAPSYSAGCAVFPCGRENFSNFGMARLSIFQSLSSLIIVSSTVPTILS